MISAFGVDHGQFSKADDKYGGHGAPTTGRRLSAHLFSGLHGGVAGKKGKKLRSVGTEIGATAGGSALGSIAGGAAGGLLSRGHMGAAHAGSSLGSFAGGVTGSQGAVNRLQRKGYYKPQKPRTP